MTVQEQIISLLKKSNGRTAREFFKAIFGKEGYQQRVNSTLLMMERRGAIRRTGKGYQKDPFTWWLK